MNIRKIGGYIYKTLTGFKNFNTFNIKDKKVPRFNTPLLFGQQRRIFRNSIQKSPYYGIFRTIGFTDSDMFIQGFGKIRSLKGDEDVKRIKTAGKKEDALYYYDINGSYRHILKTRKFRVGNGSRFKRGNDELRHLSIEEQLIKVESSNLDDYNYLIYVQVYHNSEVISKRCARLGCPSPEELTKLNVMHIDKLRINFPSLYRPYFSPVREDKNDSINRRKLNDARKFSRRIILERKPAYMWVLKEEVDYGLKMDYIIKPIVGYNRYGFSELPNELIKKISQNTDEFNKILDENVLDYTFGPRRQEYLGYKSIIKRVVNIITGLTGKVNITLNGTKYNYFELADYYIKYKKSICESIDWKANLYLPSNFISNNTRFLYCTYFLSNFIEKILIERVITPSTVCMYYEIISSGRIRIHEKLMEALRNKGRIYYSNTDSLITNYRILDVGSHDGKLKEQYKEIIGVYIRSYNNYYIITKTRNHFIGTERPYISQRIQRSRRHYFKDDKNLYSIDSIPLVYDGKKAEAHPPKEAGDVLPDTHHFVNTILINFKCRPVVWNPDILPFHNTIDFNRIMKLEDVFQDPAKVNLNWKNFGTYQSSPLWALRPGEEKIVLTKVARDHFNPLILSLYAQITQIESKTFNNNSIISLYFDIYINILLLTYYYPKNRLLIQTFKELNMSIKTFQLTTIRWLNHQRPAVLKYVLNVCKNNRYVNGDVFYKLQYYYIILYLRKHRNTDKIHGNNTVIAKYSHISLKMLVFKTNTFRKKSFTHYLKRNNVSLITKLNSSSKQDLSKNWGLSFRRFNNLYDNGEILSDDDILFNEKIIDSHSPNRRVILKNKVVGCSPP